MARLVRVIAACLVALLVGELLASSALARGGMGGGGGGGAGKRGKKEKKGVSAQQQQLIQDTYRRDLLLRSRLRDW